MLSPIILSFFLFDVKLLSVESDSLSFLQNLYIIYTQIFSQANNYFTFIETVVIKRTTNRHLLTFNKINNIKERYV